MEESLLDLLEKLYKTGQITPEEYQKNEMVLLRADARSDKEETVKIKTARFANALILIFALTWLGLLPSCVPLIHNQHQNTRGDVHNDHHNSDQDGRHDRDDHH